MASTATRRSIRSLDGRSLDGLAIEAAERSLSIASDRDDGSSGRGPRSRELDVELPRDATVVVEVASADIRSTGLHGDQRYRSTAGDMQLHSVSGSLTIEVVSGDVDVIADGPAAVNARTVSGDLALRAGLLSTLRVNTTSGDVRVAGDLRGDGPFTIESVSGDVVLAPAGGLRVEMSTIAGDLRTDLQIRREEGPGPRAIIVADGGPTLRFRSTSGDLRLVRAAALSVHGTERPAPPPAAEPAPERPSATVDDHVPEPGDDAALVILRALERGEIDVAEADRRLGALEPTDA